jgi:sugar phosphate isomerase/epimerase
MKTTRRAFLLSPAALLAQSRTRLRYAICSETFVGSRIAEACRAAQATGYDGIEIEPAQLSPDPAALTAGERTQIRKAMADHGVRYAGLHSLLRAPAGLHLTTPDAAVRARSWDYFRRLIDLAASLGEQAVMVLGSSRQRMAIDGSTPADAVKRLTEGLAGVAGAARERGVTILVEPLAPHLCNVVNTLAEAMEIVRAVASPAVETMFDTHNTAAEKEPPAILIRKYLPHIRHVHLNEMDGRRPGAGDYPFLDVLRALREVRYRHWVSVEAFDFKPDGETVARQAREFLRNLDTRLDGSG